MAQASSQPSLRAVGQNPSDPRELYLSLLKGVLTRTLLPDEIKEVALPTRGRGGRVLAPLVRRVLERWNLVPARRVPYDLTVRIHGKDYQPPAEAETMIGMLRLDNLQRTIVDVLEREVAGDLVETGVWRGGATIFMRAVLQAYGDADRCVWVADSFKGLPAPRPDCYPADEGDRHHTRTELAVSLDEVRGNFERYGLLDDRVRFLPGWFHETLPEAPIERLAILRLDGDMYESTIVALKSLYEKVSPGGYVIVDDYGAVQGCHQAVDDFRDSAGISEPLEWIDWGGIFWQKSE